ncbi:TetR/AcrR family transcriptional regulator [Kitasatospora viridis]|uniref:TetR family transcriptional regulator n=1 Tax=Kitasatospora viridis TaxID=281105 RepID=A0A561UIU8_9ACTN|nr:TetR/AcrR family transcriptional regulator [Kitasatospora viridis]TWF99267.1 TetR family transcriptional regulator [Kitasatospora viridis]
MGDARIARGNLTRRTVLQRAAEIASVEGLENISLGRLAAEVGISKSGIFALFGSKEELQLATVRSAISFYLEHLITPNRQLPEGIVKVRLLCDSWLRSSMGRVFPGGCFFFATSVEFAARPGPVRDLLAGAQREWIHYVERVIVAAIEAGELTADTDPATLAFELLSLLDGANSTALLHDDDTAYQKAATAILRRLRSAATDPALLCDPPALLTVA